MNRLMYECGTRQKDVFELGDVIYCNDKKYMIFITSNKKIGLVDIGSAVASGYEFKSLDELTKHFKNKPTEDGEIYCEDLWVYYVP